MVNGALFLLYMVSPYSHMNYSLQKMSSRLEKQDCFRGGTMAGLFGKNRTGDRNQNLHPHPKLTILLFYSY
jgi:hypothetical protein